MKSLLSSAIAAATFAIGAFAVPSIASAQPAATVIVHRAPAAHHHVVQKRVRHCKVVKVNTWRHGHKVVSTRRVCR